MIKYRLKYPNSGETHGSGLPEAVRVYGKTGSLKSLHQFLIEKGTSFAVRVNGDKPSFVETTFTDLHGVTHPFRLLSLPFYLCNEVFRLAEDLVPSA